MACTHSKALCTPTAPCVLQVIIGSESHILNYEGGGASAYGGIIYRTGVDWTLMLYTLLYVWGHS